MNYVLAFRPGVSAACKLVKAVFYQSLAFGSSNKRKHALSDVNDLQPYVKNASVHRDLRGVRPWVPFEKRDLVSHMVS